MHQLISLDRTHGPGDEPEWDSPAKMRSVQRSRPPDPLGLCSFADSFNAALKGRAQDGRGIKRAAQKIEAFLTCLAARIRALCLIGRPAFRETLDIEPLRL